MEGIEMYGLLYFPKMATANIPSHMLLFQYEVDTPPESDEVYLPSPWIWVRLWLEVTSRDFLG